MKPDQSGPTFLVHKATLYISICSSAPATKMSMKAVVSRSTLSRFMEANFHPSSLTGLRRFSDKGRILSEEERAKETVYIQKMERERLEKLRKKAEKEKAEQSDKKGEGEAQKN